MSLIRFLAVFTLSLAFLSKAHAEAHFVLEYFQKDPSKAESTAENKVTQTVSFKESEKEKKFVREADKAQCLMSLGAITPLVSSYRKVEMLLECQGPYTKVSSSFICLYSEPDAPVAQVKERRSKVKDLQVDLGDLPKGVEVKRPKKHHFKRTVTKLTPAWDSNGCQNLGEGLDHLGTENLRSRVRCCYLK